MIYLTFDIGLELN